MRENEKLDVNRPNLNILDPNDHKKKAFQEDSPFFNLR